MGVDMISGGEDVVCNAVHCRIVYHAKRVASSSLVYAKTLWPDRRKEYSPLICGGETMSVHRVMIEI